MKRTSLLGLGLVALAVTACGSGEVVVSAEIEVPNPDTGEATVRPIEDLAIQLLPYDRDAIFDSLAAAATTPEPQLPAALQIARDSIAAAQAEWRESESRWLTLRDRLQEINEELAQYNPAEAQYRALFNEFDEVDAQAAAAESTKDAAFELYDRLQQETFAELEAFRAEETAWGDVAFASFSEVTAEKIRAAGREVVADTTDATGVTVIEAAPGEWWLYARYPYATEEFYWNLPLQLESGTPLEVNLSRSNAEIREIF